MLIEAPIPSLAIMIYAAERDPHDYATDSYFNHGRESGWYFVALRLESLDRDM